MEIGWRTKFGHSIDGILYMLESALVLMTDFIKDKGHLSSPNTA